MFASHHEILSAEQFASPEATWPWKSEPTYLQGATSTVNADEIETEAQ